MAAFFEGEISIDCLRTRFRFVDTGRVSIGFADIEIRTSGVDRLGQCVGVSVCRFF